MSSLKRKVVVTGMGAVTPLGNSLQMTWNKLCLNNNNASSTAANNVRGAMTSIKEALEYQQLPRDVLELELNVIDKLSCQVAAPVKSQEFAFDTRTSRFVQFALAAAEEAVLQANLRSYLGLYDVFGSDGDSNINETYIRRRERTGVCIGCGIGSVRDMNIATASIQKRGSPHRVSPHFVPRVLVNSAAARVSMEYQTYGPNHAVSTACAAGAHSLGDAMRFIQYGDADVMLAGGTEGSIDALSLAGFAKLRALSTGYNDTPNEASRPFDNDRDGFVMGEGATIFVLEEFEHAKNRGAEILCEIAGYGLSSDAYHITAPDKNGSGAERAINAAIMNAGLSRNDIDYVNCHATSTPIGDSIEASMLERVMKSRERKTDLFVSSTKGATGHLLGAAGSLEAAFTALAIINGKIPPTHNLQNYEEIDGINFVANQSVKSDVKVAISNSFGFGGTNTSLVFRSVNIQ